MKKSSWWPECPYKESVFPAPRNEYKEIVPDPHIRTALSGILGREFWGITIESVELALRDYLNLDPPVDKGLLSDRYKKFVERHDLPMDTGGELQEAIMTYLIMQELLSKEN